MKVLSLPLTFSIHNQHCTLYTVRGVRGLEIRMLTLGTKTSLYTEDRGFQVLMTPEHDKIVGTQFCDKTVPHLLRPDPRVRRSI
jgi:hypothetical protein